MTQAEAETRLAELELVALPVQQANDESVPVGSVISWTVPADAALTSGGQVLPGGEVQLVVSTGPAPRTIPTLVGLTVDQATTALQQLQLGVTVGEPVFSDTIAAGSVVSASPPDGTTDVARGTNVTLTPSKGVDLVTMPDLTGQALPQAQASLAAAGLQTGALLGDTQGIFVSATVVGQNAPAGVAVQAGIGRRHDVPAARLSDGRAGRRVVGGDVPVARLPPSRRQEGRGHGSSRRACCDHHGCGPRPGAGARPAVRGRGRQDRRQRRGWRQRRIRVGRHAGRAGRRRDRGPGRRGRRQRRRHLRLGGRPAPRQRGDRGVRRPRHPRQQRRHPA